MNLIRIYIGMTQNINRFITALDSDTIGEAYQHKMRIAHAEKESCNRYWEDYDLSIKNSTVREITYKDAKNIIDKYEWIGRMPVCVEHCYGLFFPSKTDNDSELLGGVTVFSHEYVENQGVWDKYGYTGKIILLARGVNLHFCPKNANSHLIMESIKLLPEKYKVITCTVDSLAGEVGTIYQACNFDYVGVMRKSKGRNGYLINGKIYSERTIRQKYGTQKQDVIKSLIPDVQIIKQKSKARYFYFRGDKRTRKQLRSSIINLIKPYPKRQSINIS